MEDVRLMKGNEAIAHAAIRSGADGYFGYPITPQSEVMETLMAEKPWETTGMVVLQAESEVSSINMVYGAAGSGKRVMTSSSSPGMSLMQEGVSYIAGAELPCLLVNVMRGGPGLGTIQPSQAISKPSKAAGMAIIASSHWPPRRCRRWPTSWRWALTWRSSIGRRPWCSLTV